MPAHTAPTARRLSSRHAALALLLAGLWTLPTVALVASPRPGAPAVRARARTSAVAEEPVHLAGPSAVADAPAAPPMDGRVIYARTAGAIWNVYRADADGDNEVRLTSNADNPWQEHVRFSPDGRTVAFDVYPGDATYSLWTVPADGGEATELAIDGNATDPAYDPTDPTRLTFALREGRDSEDPHDIMRIAADGAVTPLIASPGVDERGPDWSPDGAQLAYERFVDKGSWDIWVANADGSNPHALVSGALNERLPRWSPDGTRLAFIEGSLGFGLGTLRVLDVASGVVHSYVEPVAGPLAWDPAGHRILFHSPRIDGPTVLPDGAPQSEGQVGLHVIDLDTREIWRLRGAAGGNDDQTLYGGYSPDWWAPSPTPTATPSPSPTATNTPPWIPGKVARLPLVVRDFAHRPLTATPTATVTATASITFTPGTPTP